MEPDDNPRSYVVVFFVLAAAGIGYLCYRVLVPFLGAIAWATILAVALQRPWSALERKFPRRRSLAAGLLTVLVALVVLFPAALLIGVLASQALDVVSRISATLNSQHITSFSDIIAKPAVASFLDDVQTRVGITPADFQTLATGFVTRASALAASLSGKLVLGLFDMALTFVFAIFLLFFLLRDGKGMASAILDLLPAATETRARIGRSISDMLQAIFRGSLLCSLIQGLSGAVGWWIAGLPSPALAGAAMAVLSLLPVGGTALVWLPGVIILWIQGRMAGAVFLLIWGVVVTSFLADNVLRPVLIGGVEELSMLVVFLGVFGGLAAFGLLGIFIGPVALVLAVTLLDALREVARGGDTTVPASG
ncbi:MAG: AI-2E family transporter [Acidobacteriota bacterium]